MTEWTFTAADGQRYTISWHRDAPWNRHWSITLAGAEVARYATYTESRQAVQGMAR